MSKLIKKLNDPVLLLEILWKLVVTLCNAYIPVVLAVPRVIIGICARVYYPGAFVVKEFKGWRIPPGFLVVVHQPKVFGVSKGSANNK